MSATDAGVVLHIDEDTTHDERESFRTNLLNMNGVMAAAYHDEKPHLMIIIYNSALVRSIEFIEAAKKHGWHAELIA